VWADFVTVFRVVLAFISIYMISVRHDMFNIIGIGLIPVVMLLDILDGYFARRNPIPSKYGSLYDILADRIISFSYFVFFASVQICPYISVLIIIVRGLILDLIRSIAFSHNMQAFSENKFNQHILTKFFTQSHFSRGLYNTLKTLIFILMATQYCFYNISPSIIYWGIWLTVIWALLRSLPVLYMGYCLVKK